MLQQYLKTKQTALNSVGFSNTEPSPNRNLTCEIILKHVSNSPLCNSSPRVSTVVPEKKLQKGTSAWVNSSVNEYPGYSWTRTCAQTTNKNAQSKGTERGCWTQAEWQRYRIRALLHLAEAPVIGWTESMRKWNMHDTHGSSSCHHLAFWSEPKWKTTILARAWTILCLYQVWSVRLW